MARTQGFLPKFGNVVIDIRQEFLGTVVFNNSGNNNTAPLTVLTAYINGIPVSREEAEVVTNVLRSANGELNVADFCPRKVKEAGKILKRLWREAAN